MQDHCTILQRSTGDRAAAEAIRHMDSLIPEQEAYKAQRVLADRKLIRLWKTRAGYVAITLVDYFDQLWNLYTD